MEGWRKPNNVLQFGIRISVTNTHMRIRASDSVLVSFASIRLPAALYSAQAGPRERRISKSLPLEDSSTPFYKGRIPRR